MAENRSQENRSQLASADRSGVVRVAESGRQRGEASPGEWWDACGLACDVVATPLGWPPLELARRRARLGAEAEISMVARKVRGVG